MFKIFEDLDLIAQFANPNRQFISDWLKSDDFKLNSYQSIWDEVTNKCLIPSILNIDVLYANFGLVNNTQHGILKVSKRLESMYWMGSNDDNTGVDSMFVQSNKRNFHTYININFFRLPSTTQWYFAPGPSVKFPKNIMYPFRIGTTQYWYTANSYLLRLDLMLLIVLTALIN